MSIEFPSSECVHCYFKLGNSRQWNDTFTSTRRSRFIEDPTVEFMGTEGSLKLLHPCGVPFWIHLSSSFFSYIESAAVKARWASRGEGGMNRAPSKNLGRKPRYYVAFL